MIGLERRYRRTLRVLPASYRQAWEQDMVATFLEGALPDDPEDAEFAAEHGRPDGAEVASVLALAVRLRLGGAGAPARFRAWGDAVRRVALAGLLVHAVNALAGVGSLFWLPARFPWLAVPDQAGAAAAFAGLSWVAAYLALVLGAWRAARLIAGLSLLVSVLTVGLGLTAGGGAYLASGVAELLVAALPVLALAAFHRDAGPVRSRPWLIALPAGTVLVTGILLLTQRPGDGVLADGPGLLCAATIVAVVVHLIAGRGGPAAAWSIALALLGFTVLGLRVVTLLDYLRFTAAGPQRDALITAAVTEAVALVLFAGPLVVRAVRAHRKLSEGEKATAPSP